MAFLFSVSPLKLHSALALNLLACKAIQELHRACSMLKNKQGLRVHGLLLVLSTTTWRPNYCILLNIDGSRHYDSYAPPQGAREAKNNKCFSSIVKGNALQLFNVFRQLNKVWPKDSTEMKVFFWFLRAPVSDLYTTF